MNGNNTTGTVNNAFLGIGNGTSTFTSSLNVSGTSIMNVGTTASRAGEIRIGNITLSGILSDVSGKAGKITKTGTGTLILSNTANTFTGQVLSDSGRIQVTKLADSGTASSVGAGVGSIRLGNNATATLDYIGTTDSSSNKVIQIGILAVDNTGSAAIVNNGSGKLTFTNATFNQAIANVTAARSLTIGGSHTGADNEIQGAIRDHNTAGGGIVSVNKTGNSTWVLSGTNTYTGATNVTGGVLAVNGNISTSVLTTVNSGAILGGSGTVGALTILEGGKLDLTLGTLTLNGDTDTLTLGKLSFNDLIGWNMTDPAVGTYTLIGGVFEIDWGSTEYISPETAFEFVNGNKGYFTSGSLNVVIIPEPRAALLGGLGLLALLRRRRVG